MDGLHSSSFYFLCIFPVFSSALNLSATTFFILDSINKPWRDGWSTVDHRHHNINDSWNCLDIWLLFIAVRRYHLLYGDELCFFDCCCFSGRPVCWKHQFIVFKMFWSWYNRIKINPIFNSLYMLMLALFKTLIFLLNSLDNTRTCGLHDKKDQKITEIFL